MKDIIRKFNKVLLYLYQLPQNIIGLLLLCFYKHEIKEKHGIIYYHCQGFSGGISLGQYILVGDEYENTIKHEYGHLIQSRLLGPLYLLIIGLPSITWAGLIYGIIVNETHNGYYKFYTERWADKLAGVKR